MPHTLALPLTVEHKTEIYDAKNQPIADIDQEYINRTTREAMDYAAQIVRAVNAHDDLVAALESACKSFAQLVRWNRIPENMAGYRNARAALAKATGGAS